MSAPSLGDSYQMRAVMNFEELLMLSVNLKGNGRWLLILRCYHPILAMNPHTLTFFGLFPEGNPALSISFAPGDKFISIFLLEAVILSSSRPRTEPQLYFGVDQLFCLGKDDSKSSSAHHPKKTRKIATMDSGDEHSIEFHVRSSWKNFDTRAKSSISRHHTL